MRCRGCGEANQPDDAFCRWCGSPLPTDPDPQPPQQAAPFEPAPVPRPPAPPRHARHRAGWVAVAAVLVLALVLLGAAGWWLWLRPADTAQSIPDAFGLIPAQPQAPTLQWSLPAATVSTSCRVPGGDTTNTPARRCELQVHEWSEQLVGSISKGTADSMRVSDLFGVSPQGGTTWRVGRLSALCTSPPLATELRCADLAGSQVFALDPQTGERTWTLPFDEPVAAIAQAGAETYLYTEPDSGPRVYQVTSRGRLAWSVDAPQSSRLVLPKVRPGPAQPDRLTVLHEGVVHLGPVQTAAGSAWAVDRDTGEQVRTAAEVLAVIRDHTTGDLVPVARQPDGVVTIRQARLVIGDDKDRPGLTLPYAMQARPDLVWTLVDDVSEPGTIYAVPGERPEEDHVLDNYWWYEHVRPVAFCGGQKALYRPVGSALLISPVRSAGPGSPIPLASTPVGFVCDGARIVQVDGLGVTAYSGPQADTAWSVPVEGATAATATSYGLLLSTEGGTSVRLYR